MKNWEEKNKNFKKKPRNFSSVQFSSFSFKFFSARARGVENFLFFSHLIFLIFSFNFQSFIVYSSKYFTIFFSDLLWLIFSLLNFSLWIFQFLLYFVAVSFLVAHFSSILPLELFDLNFPQFLTFLPFVRFIFHLRNFTLELAISDRVDYFPPFDFRKAAEFSIVSDQSTN